MVRAGRAAKRPLITFLALLVSIPGDAWLVRRAFIPGKCLSAVRSTPTARFAGIRRWSAFLPSMLIPCSGLSGGIWAFLRFDVNLAGINFSRFCPCSRRSKGLSFRPAL